MKVFKFYCGELYYAYAAQTKEEAIEQFTEETGDQYTAIDEIPESEWDKKMISVWEDNNFDKKPYKISIREAICGVDALWKRNVVLAYNAPEIAEGRLKFTRYEETGRWTEAKRNRRLLAISMLAAVRV